MQMTAASDELIDYVEKQIVSNAEVMNSPLPAAGRSGELSAANQSTLDEVAARIAALGQQGSAEGSGAAALQAARGGWNPTKAHGRRKKKA
jgi:cell pole-organizing protein PopZ